jgi:hypothetical protein
METILESPKTYPQPVRAAPIVALAPAFGATVFDATVSA